MRGHDFRRNCAAHVCMRSLKHERRLRTATERMDEAFPFFDKFAVYVVIPESIEDNTSAPPDEK